MTIDTCRQHGDGEDFRAHAVTHSTVNSYDDDPHVTTGHFDFVLANPPFNVNAVDDERLKDMVGTNRRFTFGPPSTDNANCLWIQIFHSALNEKGRAGFFMANGTKRVHSCVMKPSKRTREDAADKAERLLRRPETPPGSIIVCRSS
jgi:type I restriction-modification system DNA methylase subunit